MMLSTTAAPALIAALLAGLLVPPAEAKTIRADNVQPRDVPARDVPAPIRQAPIVQAQAQKPAPDAGEGQDEDGAAVTPLAVGALRLASDPALVVESIGIDVTPERVTYAYQLKNKGTAALSLGATVAMPDLEISSDDDTVYELPAHGAENPVNLAVQSDGKPVTSAPTVMAFALGVDRVVDLKAAQIPLIPFDADKALAAATPDTLAKLARLGLVSPRDPANPDPTVVADWSLQVTHAWMQSLEPGRTTALSIGFAPIKASYTVDKDALASFDPLKDQICLTPKIAGALKADLKAKGATFTVIDIILADDKPTRWTDSPTVTIAVHKPKPSSIVVFCGADAASAAEPVAHGAVAEDSGNSGTRVMIFTPDVP